jgi:hypothetical protein
VLEDIDKVLAIIPHSLPTLLAKVQILTLQGKFKDSLTLSEVVINNATTLLAGAFFNNFTASFAMKQYQYKKIFLFAIIRTEIEIQFVYTKCLKLLKSKKKFVWCIRMHRKEIWKSKSNIDLF